MSHTNQNRLVYFIFSESVCSLKPTFFDSRFDVPKFSNTNRNTCDQIVFRSVFLVLKFFKFSNETEADILLFSNTAIFDLKKKKKFTWKLNTVRFCRLSTPANLIWAATKTLNTWYREQFSCSKKNICCDRLS